MDGHPCAYGSKTINYSLKRRRARAFSSKSTSAANQKPKLTQRQANRIKLEAMVNANSARHPSEMALISANFWTTNGKGTHLVAHLAVIFDNKLALQVCMPGKVLQKLKDAPSCSICQLPLDPTDTVAAGEEKPPRSGLVQRIAFILRADALIQTREASRAR